MAEGLDNTGRVGSRTRVVEMVYSHRARKQMRRDALRGFSLPLTKKYVLRRVAHEEAIQSQMQRLRHSAYRSRCVQLSAARLLRQQLLLLKCLPPAILRNNVASCSSPLE